MKENGQQTSKKSSTHPVDTVVYTARNSYKLYTSKKTMILDLYSLPRSLITHDSDMMDNSLELPDFGFRRSSGCGLWMHKMFCERENR